MLDIIFYRPGSFFVFFWNHLGINVDQACTKVMDFSCYPDVKKNKKKAKDLNKKDMSGTDMDAFVDSSVSLKS